MEFLRHVAPSIRPDSIGASQKTRKFSKFLIANEMHSRKRLSASKQATYNFLIANEFQSQNGNFDGLARLDEQAVREFDPRLALDPRPAKISLDNLFSWPNTKPYG